MNAGAILAAKQNKYIRTFQEAGATDAGHAATLKELGCRDSLVFQRLVNRGVFSTGPDGRYHLNVEAAEAFVAARRVRILAAVMVVLTVMVVVMWLSSRG